MASPDVRNVIEGMTGSLCIDPTSMSTAFPHGGTALGVVRDEAFEFGERYFEVRAEEYGGVTVEVIRSGPWPRFSALLSEFDDDAVSAIFPHAVEGSTGRYGWKYDAGTDGTRAGQKLSGSAVKLLFSPKAIDSHHHILIYRAIPMPDDAARLQLQIGKDVGMAVVFLAVPDASKRVYHVGQRGDLTL